MAKNLGNNMEINEQVIRELPRMAEDWTKDYYEINFFCRNCYTNNHKLVKKKFTTQGFKITCKNCECEVWR